MLTDNEDDDDGDDEPTEWAEKSTHFAVTNVLSGII